MTHANMRSALYIVMATALIGATVAVVMYLRSPKPQATQHAANASATSDRIVGPVGATGVPIDPNLKTVSVVAPSGSDEPLRGIDKKLEKLRQEQALSDSKLKRQLTVYTQKVNTSTADQKRAYVQAMTPEMDDYKRRSLEIFKLEQAKRQSLGAASARDSLTAE